MQHLPVASFVSLAVAGLLAVFQPQADGEAHAAVAMEVTWQGCVRQLSSDDGPVFVFDRRPDGADDRTERLALELAEDTTLDLDEWRDRSAALTGRVLRGPSGSTFAVASAEAVDGLCAGASE